MPAKMVDIAPGSSTMCGVVHCPVPCDELCFVDSKVELGLSFNVFEQSNKDGAINYLSIQNKTELHLTIQRRQQIGTLYLEETVKIPIKF